MAEVGNLLGLITDEETRTKLIAQMEQMFDAAEDEQKLIEQIGSPTKVAVALIRYADRKRTAPAQGEPGDTAETPVTEMMAEAQANAAAPDGDVMPELAYVEETAAAPEAPEQSVPAPVVPVVPDDEFDELFEEAPAEAEAPVVDEVLVQAVAAEAAEAFVEVPAEEQLAEELPAAPAAEAPAETAAEAEKDLAEELFGKPKKESAAEEAEEEEPDTEIRTIGWKAFLYFLIPGLVPGLPVFLVLFALSLVFLAVGVAAIGCAVSVFMSAFIGFNVVADMLLLLGAGASIFAVAIVLMWFAIWFLTQVCFGWVRLMHRGGVRFSRKEVLSE